MWLPELWQEWQDKLVERSNWAVGPDCRLALAWTWSAQRDGLPRGLSDVLRTKDARTWDRRPLLMLALPQILFRPLRRLCFFPLTRKPVVKWLLNQLFVLLPGHRSFGKKNRVILWFNRSPQWLSHQRGGRLEDQGQVSECDQSKKRSLYEDKAGRVTWVRHLSVSVPPISGASDPVLRVPASPCYEGGWGS